MVALVNSAEFGYLDENVLSYDIRITERKTMWYAVRGIDYQQEKIDRVGDRSGW